MRIKYSPENVMFSNSDSTRTALYPRALYELDPAWYFIDAIKHIHPGDLIESDERYHRAGPALPAKMYAYESDPAHDGSNLKTAQEKRDAASLSNSTRLAKLKAR